MSDLKVTLNPVSKSMNQHKNKKVQPRNGVLLERYMEKLNQTFGSFV